MAGRIRDDVETHHLQFFLSERPIISAFTPDFSVNWARRRTAYGAEASVYLLGPEPHMTDSFGLEREVMLIVTSYNSIQPRLMQAVDHFYDDEPMRGRVDQSIFFLFAPLPSAKDWVGRYLSEHPQSRIPVVFAPNDIEAARRDSWYVRSVLGEQLYHRDLFDYTLPLNNDLFFFGRDSIVAEYLDAIRKSQNRGLFGLRKIGKTSVLYKVRRLAERSDIARVLHYDCKLPSIRQLRWEVLLLRIIDDIHRTYKIQKLKKPVSHISDHFIEVLRQVPARTPLCLIFDEVEYISPLATEDLHWHKDFTPFWQTLWTAQSEYRKLSYIVAGVNPTVTENDLFGGVQNPMFGIIRPTYLQGLDDQGLYKMVRFFGKRMGLNFSRDALEYLRERYGSHPLLVRMACSYVHLAIESQRKGRPVDLTAETLRAGEEERDGELVFYCRHIVSELKGFYPDEYHMLELLACGNEADFMELGAEPEWTRHLRKYGLVLWNDVRKPRFAIPVVGRYIAAEWARNSGAALRRSVVPADLRQGWLSRRKIIIAKEVRELERIARRMDLPELYGRHSIPEAERFAAVRLCDAEESFDGFINVMNRCFVESIEQAAKGAGKQGTVWEQVKQHYPDLCDALRRIKVYRNNNFHLSLYEHVESELQRYLLRDLEGKRPGCTPDGWFVLQQSVMDGLHLAIQCEINRYS